MRLLSIISALAFAAGSVSHAAPASVRHGVATTSVSQAVPSDVTTTASSPTATPTPTVADPQSTSTATPSPGPSASGNSTPPVGGIVPGRYFDRFIIIKFENRNFDDAVRDPYLGELFNKTGFGLSNYFAVTHPSQPNYIAMLYADDPWLQYPALHYDKRVDIDGRNLVDQLEEKGVSWKTYQQDLPNSGQCFDGDSGLYRRKHNPFISMKTVSQNPDRCQKIVDFNQLDTDVQNGELPQYAFITPNMQNDGHDSDTPYLSNFLKGFLEPRLSNQNFKGPRTVILVTFDESETYTNNNQVYATLITDVLTDGAKGDQKYSHYSVVKTIQDNWLLGSLGRKDEDATSLVDLFKS